ncbi:glycosyltransferase family 39 protein [Anaeromyxobacter paludicola]|uniref:Glycosyltransferase RgtA/B/C/D-like domain-containing protein n=1 Tax=Anaeromyxobacter paludicola TaxID=2918171 RepID=A0ABN6NAP0_9BACT|nr:glycosyltransferase family 39 protein [Anaeromyxobacter paludicola]BDG09415.1 hypothetical protein AMPC_25280 [Anaeromyxobacter paludicola]
MTLLSRPGDRRAFAALSALVLATRLPGFAFGLLNIDECDFTILARAIASGARLYVDVADIKPPLAYLAFLPSGLAYAIWPMRLAGVLLVLATALLARAAARAWTGDDRAGWCAAFAAVLAGMVELPSVSAELVMNLPAAAALLLFVRARREGRPGLDLAAGLCVGAASLVKHQAAVLDLGLGLALLWEARDPRARRGALRGFGLLALGSALPWLATSAWFAAQGRFAPFYDWVFARNFLYVSRLAGDAALPRFAASFAECVLGATGLLWALAALETRRALAPDPIRRGLALTLLLTWLPVSAGGRFYEHYFLQFAPPLAILAAPGLAAITRAWGGLGRFRRAGLAALLALPVLGTTGYAVARGLLRDYPGQEPRANALAAWLRENTAPTDRLFVWGHFSPIYYLSQRLPGTRYLTCSVHEGNFDPGHLPDGFDAAAHRSERDVRATLEDLEANRPALFVDTGPADIHHWSRVPLAAFPDLRDYLLAHYAPVATPGGAVVYRRLPERGPEAQEKSARTTSTEAANPARSASSAAGSAWR